MKAKYAGDGQYYAVKMAPLDSTTSANEAKQEALNFADMNHNNIVRYYDVWVEEFDAEKRKGQPKKNLFIFFFVLSCYFFSFFLFSLASLSYFSSFFLSSYFLFSF